MEEICIEACLKVKSTAPGLHHWRQCVAHKQSWYCSIQTACCTITVAKCDHIAMLLLHAEDVGDNTSVCWESWWYIWRLWATALCCHYTAWPLHWQATNPSGWTQNFPENWWVIISVISDIHCCHCCCFCLAMCFSGVFEMDCMNRFLYTDNTFLPCCSYTNEVFLWASVRPSVCLSVKCVNCNKMKAPSKKKFNYD